GWPYPDTGIEISDPAADADDDLVSLVAAEPHLFDRLDPVEREVITGHYGLAGRPARTMRQLHSDTGLSRAELRDVLGAALAKLREQLQA
ncbi:MAG: hypothetical protein ACRDY5_02505, partial [Acidimicrobiales bacterium]